MRVWLLFALVACHGGGGDGPPCTAVGGTFFLIAHGELEHGQFGAARSGEAGPIDDSIRRAVTAQLPAMRDSLTQQCTDGAWSRAVRDCMVHATDHAGLQACEAQLTGDQRAALDRSSAPSGGADAETNSP
jgi:hypothetical protein